MAISRWVGGSATLALTLAVASLACGSDGEPSDSDVPVRVERVGLDANQLPVVVLEEHSGPRWLPIWIGSAEAQSIASEIQKRHSPRPNTHDLTRRVIDGLQGELERVVVTELRAGTYYATLTLRSGGQLVEIDSRPSDAIAIALRTGAPIFVRASLFSESGLDLDPDDAASI